jgi:hypothetical protein
VRNPPPDHFAPTTGSNPDELARWYGYKSLRHLAKDIPRGGLVLDLGAGISLFGEELSRYRGLHVVALDRRYRDPVLARALAESRPKRSRHVAADATQLPFKPESFDAVFSSLLFLDLLDRSRALAAAAEVFDVLKLNAFAKIGPNQPRIAPRYRAKHGIPLAFTAVKEATTSREDFAGGVVNATALTPIARLAEERCLSPKNDLPDMTGYANHLRLFRLQGGGGHRMPGWVAPPRRLR